MTLAQAADETGWTISRVRYLWHSGRVRGREVWREVPHTSPGSDRTVYMALRKRIEVAHADVLALLDDTPTESAYWMSAIRVAKTLGVTRHAITNMCKQGRIRAVRGVLQSNRTGWLIPRTEMATLHEHYDQPGMRKKQVRQRMIDGEMRYSCTRCGEYKPIDGFRKAKSTQLGITSRCSACMSELQRERRSSRRDREKEADRASYKRRRDRAKREGGEAHRRYEKDRIVEPEDLWRVIDEHCPGIAYTEVGRLAGIHMDQVRRTRRTRCTVSIADRILTGLDLGHLLDEVVEPPGIDNWSSSGLRRCRGCGRCDMVHVGRGYCYLCRSLADRGFDPKFHTGWSRNAEVTCCRRCGMTEREHFLRGLCSPCFYEAKKLSLLDNYPPLYHPSSTEEGAGEHGDSGVDAE